MDALIVTPERPETADVKALLQRHFDLMREGSPEESCHVMAPDTLGGAGVHLLGLRQDGTLLGLGALAAIGPQQGELKSMHTAQEARGKGVARHILRALLDVARSQGMIRVSLETGTAPPFAAARALYLSEGFEECPPFGTYVYDPLSVFMARKLGACAA